jgi:hypothetical protein
MYQRGEPRGPLDEGADGRALQSDEEIALLVPGDGPVVGLGRAFADHHLWGDMRPGF